MDTSMLPFAKPPPRKQKKARNNKRPSCEDTCAICGKPYAELHEIYYGSGKRQLSIKYKMQIRLCEEHHRGNEGVHNNIELDLKLKRQFQHNFESLHGRKKFMDTFGKNYISEVENIDTSNRPGANRIGICNTRQKSKAG